MKRHPEEYRQHEIIDHIRDALEAHLCVKVYKDNDNQISFTNSSPGAYEQNITIQMDVFVDDYYETRRKARRYDEFTLSWNQMGDRP